MTTSIVFADIFRLVVFLILFLILLFDFLSLISSQLDFLPVDCIPRCLHYSYPNSIMLAAKKSSNPQLLQHQSWYRVYYQTISSKSQLYLENTQFQVILLLWPLDFEPVNKTINIYSTGQTNIATVFYLNIERALLDMESYGHLHLLTQHLSHLKLDFEHCKIVLEFHLWSLDQHLHHFPSEKWGHGFVKLVAKLIFQLQVWPYLPSLPSLSLSTLLSIKVSTRPGWESISLLPHGCPATTCPRKVILIWLQNSPGARGRQPVWGQWKAA